jgi:hypothetical protein
MDSENSIKKEVQVSTAKAPEESETADACLVMKDELESKAQRVVDDQETAGKDLKKVQTSAAVSEAMKDELESKADCICDKSQDTDDSEVQVLPPADKGAQTFTGKNVPP